MLTNDGQRISAPVSIRQGLVTFVAVLPRAPGSQYSILRTTWLGGETLIDCGAGALGSIAAVSLLRRLTPGLKIRVVNVVDLMSLQPPGEHPHGLPDSEFDAIFTRDRPIIFAFHGYPWLIHRLTYRRTNHDNLHVRGYKEEGTTTTPFDMVVLNDLDRFHLAGDVIDRVPQLGAAAVYAKQALRDRLIDHKEYIAEHGEDMPEIRHWRWSGGGVAAGAPRPRKRGRGAAPRRSRAGWESAPSMFAMRT